MPQWSPANRLGNNVAIRLKQTIMIEGPQGAQSSAPAVSRSSL
jgi:hypothetical protein